MIRAANVQLARLEGYAHIKVTVRTDWARGGVAARLWADATAQMTRAKAGLASYSSAEKRANGKRLRLKMMGRLPILPVTYDPR